jgi:hypothetical protein
MEKHWSDFSKTQRLLDPLLRKFFADVQASPTLVKSAPVVSALIQRLDKYLNTPPTTLDSTHRSPPPDPIFPASFHSGTRASPPFLSFRTQFLPYGLF